MTAAGRGRRDGDDLPADVKRDLDRAAAGVGRVATAAHPDCVCGKLVGSRRLPQWIDEDESEVPVYGQRKDCSQHGPERP